MYSALRAAEVPLAEEQIMEQRLADLRGMYESYVSALDALLLLPLPTWIGSGTTGDWQTSTWST